MRNEIIYGAVIRSQEEAERVLNFMGNNLPSHFLRIADRYRKRLLVTISVGENGIYKEEIGSKPHAQAFSARLRPLVLYIYLPQALKQGSGLKIKVLLQ